MNISWRVCDYVKRHVMNNDSEDCTRLHVSRLISRSVISLVSVGV